MTPVADARFPVAHAACSVGVQMMSKVIVGAS